MVKNSSPPFLYILDDLNRGFVDTTYTQLQVPNPFKDLLPETVGLGRNGNTSRAQLMRPYPGYGDTLRQFTNPWGSFCYDALQVRAEKRAFSSRNAGVLTFILA